MRLSPNTRTAALGVHVAASMGWLGAVVSVLALAVIGITTDDEQRLRACYIAIDLVGRSVLVPISGATLVTGLVMSFGTKWGLLLHYWVVFKLVMTVVAGGVLLAYLETIQRLAHVATAPALSAADRAALRDPTVVLHSVLAMLVLGTAMGLAIFKPQGLTRRGRRTLRARHERRA